MMRQAAITKYRPEIDGLRAIAVMAVVLFHYHICRRLGGGFVGVDIFFVLSGYLISSILLGELSNKRYSILDFYDRRIRRIFPALILMLAAVLLGSIYFLPPPDVQRISRLTMGSMFFYSNILNSATGYFDHESNYNPVLHIWSLSVEEQFYIFFPFLLGAVARRPLVAKLSIAAIAAASLAASVWMTQRNQNHAFYLVQYRAFELLLGSMLAIGLIKPLTGRLASEGSSFLGLFMIAFSINRFSNLTPFPGAYALFPCCGTMLVIHSSDSRKTLVSRVLSLQPIRFVGLISYSLYLWHWPILVFYRLTVGEPTSIATKGALITLSFLIASFSTFLVEKPFRKGSSQGHAKRNVLVGTAAMASIGCLSLSAAPWAHEMWSGPPAALQALSYIDSNSDDEYRAGKCFITSANDITQFDEAECLRLSSDGRLNYLLIGDSHAAQFWGGLSSTYRSVNFLQATASGCKPILPLKGATRCTTLMRLMFSEFLPKHKLDGIIIAGNWDESNLRSLVSTARELREQVPHVIVFGPIVHYDTPLPHLLARALIENDPGLPGRHLGSDTKIMDQELASQFSGTGVQYVSLYRALCTGLECLNWAGPGVPLQFDEAHLTSRGAETLLQRLQLFPVSHAP